MGVQTRAGRAPDPRYGDGGRSAMPSRFRLTT